MRTAVKIISSLIILLILLFIITIIVLINVVNPNDYKKYFDHYVYQNTGRHLMVANVGWSFVPWLGVNLQNVQLTNPEGFQGPNLADIENIQIKMRFWPLLIGDVQVGHVVINKATISMITNTEGKTNYSAWEGTKTTNNPQLTQPIQTKTNKKVPIPIRTIEIAGINITNSAIHFINQKENTQTIFNDFTLTTGTIENKKNFPVMLNVNSNQQGKDAKTSITIRTTANIDFVNEVYFLHSMIINATMTRPNLPTIVAVVKGSVMMGLLEQTLTFSPFTLQFANMTINGNLHISQLLQTPQIIATLSSTQTELEKFVTALQGKSFIKGTLSYSMDLTTSGTSKEDLIHNLNGKGNMAIKDGAVLGINVDHLLAQADALVEQKSPPPQTNNQETNFSNLSGSFSLTNGILRNSDVSLESGHVRALGAGIINLNNNNINYILTAGYYTNAQAQIEIPILIQGDLLHPTIKPDFSNLARKILTNAIKKKVEEYSGDVGKKLNFKKLFQGF